MNHDQVDRQECPVTLFLGDGMVREGRLQFDTAGATHAGARTALELFEEPAPFFPFRKADGTVSLINKATVSHLRFQPGTAPPSGGPPLEVRMVFLGGEVLQGTLVPAAGGGREHLQKFFNGQHNFFLLDCGAAHYLVNSRLICEITLL